MLTAQTLPCGTKRGCFFELVVFLLVISGNVFMQIHEINPTGKFPKRPWNLWKASTVHKQSKYCNIGVFSLIETGKEKYMCWRERPTLSLYPNAIGKTSLTCQTYLYDCMRTNIGRAVRRHTLGIVMAIICNIDK